jgi:hypothetical protein
MNRWTNALCGAVAACALLAGTAAAQQPQPQTGQASPKGDCKAPAKVDAQVESVDQSSGKVRVRDSSGQSHEFQASRETLQTMKPGDRIEATLRQAPKC